MDRYDQRIQQLIDRATAERGEAQLLLLRQVLDTAKAHGDGDLAAEFARHLIEVGSHQGRFDSPLPGWNSHADPFGMTLGYKPAEGAVRGRVGTPDILSMLALEAALDVWDGVSVEAVRAKSLALTDFFLECVEAYAPEGRVTSLTPSAHEERGSANMRVRSLNEMAASGFGSRKMWRWSNAASRRMCLDSSMPLPNTSPDMSPIPTQVKSSLWQSRPSARKWRLTDSQPPFAVMPMPLWS